MASTAWNEHTLVVGGGLAGLTAATYLARGGRAVTVVERAASLGGRSATDRPAGFALNRGAHALYTGGAAADVLRELGVRYTYGIPKRVLVRDDRGFHDLPGNPVGLLRTTLLDAGDKREFAGFFLRLGSLS